jgi:hypothetical protein
VWNVHSVLNVLHSLVDKSNINRQLEVYNSSGNPDEVTLITCTPQQCCGSGSVCFWASWIRIL